MRILGVTIKNNMFWDGHVTTSKDALLPKIRKQIGAIFSLRQSLTMKGRLHIVNALIMSRMTYMVSVWGQTTDNTIKRAQITQNAAARMITGMKRTTRQMKLMESCNWMNMKEQTLYHSGIQIWKTLKFKKPEYLWNRLQLETEGRISTDIPRLQMTEGAFRCKATTFWNQIPSEIRDQTNILPFKKQLRRHITNLKTCQRPRPRITIWRRTR